MQFNGDNGGFGDERVDLTEERYVDVRVEGDEPFPLGVAGLLPVVTSRRKKGGFKTVYALPLAQGPIRPFEDAPEQAPEQRSAQEALEGELAAVLDFVNVLLGEARELSGHDFGTIGGIWGGVPQKGYGFTRVELAPEDDLGGRGATPVHLRIETTERPGEPGSLSAVVEYDQLGYALHVLITEAGEQGGTTRIMSDVDFDEGDILVQKVVSDCPPDPEPRVLYWRHPPYWYEGPGSEGREDRGDRDDSDDRGRW